MTWASISLRKMELKNRINNLESQLIEISKQMQTSASEKSGEQTKITLQKNYRASIFNNQYLNNLNAIQKTDFDFKDMNVEGMEAYRDKYNQGRDPADQIAFNVDEYMLSLAKDEIIGNIKNKHPNGGTGMIDLVQQATSLTNLPYSDTTQYPDYGIDISKYTKGTNGYTDAQVSVLQQGFREAFPITLEDNGYVGPSGQVFDGVNYDTDYLTATAAATINYNDQNMELETLTQAQSDVLRNEADAESQTLSAQQEDLQTQLKVARAEYDSLGDALDNDISKGAIKLV